MVALFLLLLLLYLCYHASAYNVTLVVENSTEDVIFTRMVYGNPGTGGTDYPGVPPGGIMNISFEHNQSLSIFFAKGCSQDKAGKLSNCSSGDCPEGGCNLGNPPMATLIYYKYGTLTTSAKFGYNSGLQASFLSHDCGCPPISCTMPLDRCPEEMRKYGELGLPVACRVVDAQTSIQCAAQEATCLSKDVVFKVKVLPLV